MSKAFLQILLPTYSRPNRAIEAIKACLDIDSSEISVFCHSNGADDMLSNFTESINDERLIYGYFDANRGALKNIKHLIMHSDADYVMLLSDEDKVISSGIIRLINDLKSYASMGITISCGHVALIDESNVSDIDSKVQSDYNQSVLGLQGINHALYFWGMLPGYVSGVLFSKEHLQRIDIDAVFCPGRSNSYPHINIKWRLMAYGLYYIADYPCVLKGREAGFGGDAWEHLTLRQTSLPTDTGTKGGSALLNSDVYGAYAKYLQYFHQIEDFRGLYYKKINSLVYLMMTIDIMLIFGSGASRAYWITGVGQKVTVKEFFCAYSDAKKNKVIHIGVAIILLALLSIIPSENIYKLFRLIYTNVKERFMWRLILFLFPYSSKFKSGVMRSISSGF